MDKTRVNIRVRQGILSGVVEEAVIGGSYVAFRGIPYAKPPVGELRFQDPLPPEPWSGTRDASKHGNVSIQKDMITRELIGDEDCLFLNVYTQDIKPQEKRATMVWIHGGAFTLGSGDATIYGPDYIIQRNVILVTLNYRLGVLGFLNLDNEVAPGNQGLKDVIMALRWVQRNISEFGGDPKNVTIFGESAGGAIVHCLTLSPLAQGLFHKAISQSGVVTNPWAFTEWTDKASNNGFLLAKKLGKTTTDPKVACEFLKSIDAKHLVKNERKFISDVGSLVIAFTPSPDSKSSNPCFPIHPRNYIDRGVQVPFLLGFNDCEGSIFVGTMFGNTDVNYLKQINADFKKAILPPVLSTLPQIPITVENLRSLYFGNKALSEETIRNYADFLGDQYFYRGIMEISDIQVNRGNSCKATYLYQFSYDNEQSPMKKMMNIEIPGTCHGAELFYLFYSHMMKDLGLPLFERDSEEYKLMECFTQMWTDFAKTGNPTPRRTDLIPVEWLPLKKGDVYDYLNIDNQLRMKFFHKGQRWDWEVIKNKL